MKVSPLVASTMNQYVTASFNAKLYYAENASTGIYSVIVMPTQPKASPHVMLLAQVTDKIVTILCDTTDRPLEDALVRVGISRESITIA